MALPDPYTPGPFHLPRHLHVARWACIAFVAPVAVAGALSAVLLWKLAHGPVDITAVSRLIEPVSVVAGKKPGHPAGRLSWSRLRVQWQPSSGGISAGLMLEARGLTVARLDGTPAEQAGEADTVLALAPLLQGIIAPRRLRLQDVTLVLRRQLVSRASSGKLRTPTTSPQTSVTRRMVCCSARPRAGGLWYRLPR